MTATDPLTSDRPNLEATALGPVWAAIQAGATQVVTTDVFDTLVWRKVAEPIDVFPVVGERLAEAGLLARDVGPASFAVLRQEAETEVRARQLSGLGQVEVRLREIYEVLPRWVLPGGLAAALELEVQVEQELLVPDLDVVELLRAAKALGRRVVAVSDTYFSPAQLRRLLDLPVLRSLELDAVLTSSDHRVNKSGGLFEVALAMLDVPAPAVVHLGDNHEADVEVPSRLGIRCFHVERTPGELGPILAAERRFRPPRLESASAARTVSGVRATRAKTLTRGQHVPLASTLRPFWRYGSAVLGPVMAGFAEWVHAYAAAEGVPRVACAMREGAFLSELIEGAGPYLGSELEAVPLWVNRDICLRASIATADPAELGRLMSRRSALTVAGACRLLGVPLSRLPALASHAGTSLDDPVVRHELFAAIGEDPTVREDVVAQARELRRRVVDHVDHVCPPEQGKLVMVDLGWGASIQRMLAEVLAVDAPGRDLAGLYLVTHEGAARHTFGGGEVPRGMEIRGYLGTFGVPDDVRLVLRSPEILEQVCMPPQGTQLDLGADGEPVIAPTSIPAQQLTEAAAVRSGVLAFQREWARYDLALDGGMPDLGKAADELRPILLRSVVAPTPEEAARFGAWAHDEGQGSARTDLVADPRAIDRLRYAGPAQARDLPMTDTYWPFALAARVDGRWPGLMLAAAAGDVPWEALGAPLDLGTFTIGSTADERWAVEVQPERNWLGRTLVTATLRGPHVPGVRLRPGDRPSVIRLDWLELRLQVQGEDDPIVVRLDAAGGLEHLQAINTFRLQPNVFIVHGTQPIWELPLAPFTRRMCHRVDLDMAFAAMEIAPVLPAGGRFANLEDAEREFARIQASSSWRVTAPLRKVRRLLR